MTRLIRCLAVFTIVAAALGGCRAAYIRDANTRLTEYYSAKVQAEANEDWRMLEVSMASLNALSADAADKAEAERNILNKVSLYRIAATAAWQSDNQNVVEFGRMGQDLCTEEVYAQVPRDCGMLLVIPTLASVDANTERLDQLRDELEPQLEPQEVATQQQSQLAVEISNTYFESLDRLLTFRLRIQQSDAHPGFKAGVDEHIVRIHCILLTKQTRGPIVLTDVPLDQFDADVKQRGCRMLEVGINKESFPCAPKNCD